MKFSENKLTIIIVLAVFFCVAIAMCAEASEYPISIRQHKPNYIMTHYSDNPDFKDDEAPHVKAQVSFAVPVFQAPKSIKGLEFIPELAFTWTAQKWPIGAESSPMEENNYAPEIYLRLNPGDTSGVYRGTRLGYLHTSTGTDSNSGSWDRLASTITFARGEWLTLYVSGWWAFKYGMETEPLKYFANFAKLEDFGGEVIVVGEFDAIRLAATLGLSWQELEAFVPLQESYNIYLYGQLHNGNVASLNRYAERELSGGAGIALMR